MDTRIFILSYELSEPGRADVSLMVGSPRGGVEPIVWRGSHDYDHKQATREIAALGRSLKKCVAEKSEATRLKNHGSVLFDVLLPEPVREALRRSEGELTIVSSAHEIPWPLLHDSETFLGLRWSLGELRTGEQLPGSQRRTEVASRLLIVADPAANLPAARFEGEALLRSLSGDPSTLGVDVRLGSLRRQDFLRMFRSYRFVHYAGHAEGPGDGAGGWRFSDGLVDAESVDVLRGGQAPELVFANACQSESGQLGEAMLGAGGRHFIGTYVDLPDLPGAEFAGRFYAALLGGEAVGTALRTARRESFERGESVWAAYRLRGAPGRIYFRARALEQWTPGIRRAVTLAVRPPTTVGDVETAVDAHEAARATVKAVVTQNGGRLLPGRTRVVRTVFGIPVTYENDVHRAARAALSLGEAMPDAVVAFEIGALTSTGVDVVGPVCFEVEESCWRLQAGVYGLENVRRRLAGYSIWGEVDGQAAPLVELHEPETSNEAPIVGRRTELAHLEAQGRKVLEDSRSLAVTIVGSAGIGKSRLARAAVARLAGDFRVLRVDATDHGAGGPYEAAGSLIRTLVGLAPDARPDRIRSSLAAYLEKLDGVASTVDEMVLSIDALLASGGENEGGETRMTALLAMLGQVEDDKAPDPESLPIAFRELITSAAKQHPLALIFEDVHNTSEQGLNLLLELLGEQSRAPLFVLCTGRSSLYERVPQWSGISGHTSMELGPLSKSESGEVLRQFLGGGEAETIQALMGRAEGNPLFLKELAFARNAGDEGAPPATVEAVMQARIDQQSPLEREVLRAASIFGRVFWAEGVKAILDGVAEVDTALARLEKARFVQVQNVSDLVGLRAWRFSHGLMQEVAYHGVMERTRRAWHARAALWFDQEVTGEKGGLWSPIASHYNRAGQWRRAASAWIEAGKHAHRIMANEDARRYLQRGLADNKMSKTKLPRASLSEAEEFLGDLMVSAGELKAAEGFYTRSLEELGDTEIYAGRMAKRAECREKLGEIEAARADIDAGLERLDVGRSEKELVASLFLRRIRGWLAYRSADFDGAERELSEVLTLIPPSQALLEGLSLNILGIVSYGKGEYATAKRRLRRALTFFDANDLKRTASCYNNLGLVCCRLGDTGGAAEWYEKAVRLHARRGDRGALAHAYNNLGSLYGEMGSFEKSEKFLRESVRIRERSGHSSLALGYANLGEVILKRNDPEGARQYLKMAIELCRDGRGPAYLLPDVLRLMAELLLARGEQTGALEAAIEAARLAEEIADPAQTAAALRVLGEVHEHGGQGEEARAAVARSIEILETTEQPIQLANSYAVMSRLVSKVDATEGARFGQMAEELRAALGLTENQ